MQTFGSSNFPVLTLNQIFMSANRIAIAPKRQIYGLGSICADWGELGRGGFLGEVLCASCRYEGKTKGNIGVLMHVLPLVFVAAATCWEKTRGCSLCLRHFGGTGGGLIDLGTDPPHAPTYPSSTTHLSVTHPPKCLLSE